MTRTLVSAAGLVPAMLLAESAGLHDLLAERVSVRSPNAAVKAASTGTWNNSTPSEAASGQSRVGQGRGRDAGPSDHHREPVLLRTCTS